MKVSATAALAAAEAEAEEREEEPEGPEEPAIFGGLSPQNSLGRETGAEANQNQRKLPNADGDSGSRPNSNDSPAATRQRKPAQQPRQPSSTCSA